jgi:hypothetical protein
MNKKQNYFLRNALLSISICAGLAQFNGTEAVEGGSGVYALGYISPQAGLMPESGTYLSYNYFGYQGKSTSAVSADRQVALPGTHLKLPVQLNGSMKTEVNSYSSLFSLTHVFAEKLLGGQAGFAVLLPYAKADLDLSGSGVLSLTSPFGHVHRLNLSGNDSQSSSGVGDTTLSGLLGWHDGRWHSMAMLNLYVPTGAYDRQRPVNIGRNHWAVEPMVALTYLNEASGLEVSGATGVTFNQKNPDTDYKSGTELHLDLSAIQHFSEQFYIGLTGYAYQQLTGDSGSGASDANKGQVYGLGPIVGGAIPVGQKQKLFVNGRYYRESGVESRLKGSTVFLTATVKF